MFTSIMDGAKKVRGMVQKRKEAVERKAMNALFSTVADLKALKASRSGIEFVEWMALLALVVIIIVVAVVLFGHRMKDWLNSLGNTLQGYFN